MHPAASVILFTTLSGAGYGLAIWVLWAQLLAPSQARPVLAMLVLAGCAIGCGLLSSLLHLGHPERFWRAFSQWRSSWLSREGVASMASFVPLGILVLMVWLDTWASPLGYVSAVVFIIIAHITIHCTSMIYACLRPVFAWNHWLVPLGYQLYALLSGGVVFVVAETFGNKPSSANILWSTLILCASAALHRYAYCRRIDTVAPAHTPAARVSALGLQDQGVVDMRPLDSPNGPNNYLMQEMGYRIARRHRDNLRNLCLIAMTVIPGMIVIAVLSGASPALLPVLLPCTAVGIAIERWLFFAEAEHRVALYYRR